MRHDKSNEIIRLNNISVYLNLQDVQIEYLDYILTNK